MAKVRYHTKLKIREIKDSLDAISTTNRTKSAAKYVLHLRILIKNVSGSSYGFHHVQYKG